MRKDGRSHDTRGICRTRAEVTALPESVLTQWETGAELKTIAVSNRITIDYVEAIVRRARKAGDHRAHRRYADCGAWGVDRQQPRRIRTAWTTLPLLPRSALSLPPHLHISPVGAASTLLDWHCPMHGKD
jgi:hypothetical protein